MRQFAVHYLFLESIFIYDYFLVNAAELYEKLKVKPVAACLYIEAAQTISHIDKADAIKAYRKACALYCDISRFDIAGRIERKIGDICYNSKHWEEAG